MVEVKLEVVNALLDYNTSLGHNWMYAMEAIVSSLYRVIKFPHQGNVVTIDQLSFYHRDLVQT